MKIINWNCNLNLSKKFEHIEKHQPDIAIIQECEKLDSSYFPNGGWYKDKKETKPYGWIGYLKKDDEDKPEFKFMFED